MVIPKPLVYFPVPQKSHARPAPDANAPASQVQLDIEEAEGADQVWAGHADDVVLEQLAHIPHWVGEHIAPVQNMLAGHAVQTTVAELTSPNVPAGHAQLRTLDEPGADTDPNGQATGDSDANLQKKLAGHMVHLARSEIQVHGALI